MRTPPTSVPELQGPTAASPRFEEARRDFQRARHELTAAALEELVTRVRIRHPEASRLVLVCDDIEDGLYLAEVDDAAGRRLDPDTATLGERTVEQVLGNLRGPDLAALDGVHHDPVEMTFAVEIDALG